MTYKLTFDLSNATLGDLANFIEAAQDLGAPNNAVLKFDGGTVSISIGEQHQAEEVKETVNETGQTFRSPIDEVIHQFKEEPFVHEFLDALRDFRGQNSGKSTST